MNDGRKTGMGERWKDWKPPVFDQTGLTKWNWMCQHRQNLKLGKGVDIGAFSYLNALHGITIEENVQIGSHCSIYTISTIDEKTGPVHLKKNCKIGTHSVVMPGVTIGKNAVVGAFSFVNKDVPDDSLAYGVPAKIVKAKKGKGPRVGK
jgi:acetyltransferase-like isoleucine patch superfamily enzyme